MQPTDELRMKMLIILWKGQLKLQGTSSLQGSVFEGKRNDPQRPKKQAFPKSVGQFSGAASARSTSASGSRTLTAGLSGI